MAVCSNVNLDKCVLLGALYSGFPRFLKVLEFQTFEFKAWKVLKNIGPWIKCKMYFVYGAISKIVHMFCQRQNEMAPMIEGGVG